MFDKLHTAATQVSRIVVGKDRQVRLALTCLLAGGHLLIDDVPGVGKVRAWCVDYLMRPEFRAWLCGDAPQQGSAR